MNVVKLLLQQPAFHSRNAASREDINAAERELGLHFATDYREYLAAFGVASFSGHELTGICKSNRLSVVAVTLEERDHMCVPDDWYVIEQAYIDGVVIWQSSSGTIYQSAPNAENIKLCESMVEYIEL